MESGERYALTPEEASLVIEALTARMNQLSLWMERATSGSQEAYYRARIGHLQRVLGRLEHADDRRVYRVRLSEADMSSARAVQRIDAAIREEPLPARSNWEQAGAWVNTYLTAEAAEQAARVWERAGLEVERVEEEGDGEQDPPSR